MHFEALRPIDLMKEPSLAEMVDKSINILSRNTENRYFLLVEGKLYVPFHFHKLVFLKKPKSCCFASFLLESTTKKGLKHLAK